MVFNDEASSNDKKVLMQTISKALDLEHSRQFRGAFLTYLRCISDCCRLLSRPCVSCQDRRQLLSLCRRCLERVEVIDRGDTARADDACADQQGGGSYKRDDVIFPSAPPDPIFDDSDVVSEAPTVKPSAPSSTPPPLSAGAHSTTEATKPAREKTDHPSPCAGTEEPCKQVDIGQTEKDQEQDSVSAAERDHKQDSVSAAERDHQNDSLLDAETAAAETECLSLEDNRLNGWPQLSPPVPSDLTDSNAHSDWEVLQLETADNQGDDSALKMLPDAAGMYTDLDRQLRLVDTTLCSGGCDVGCSDIVHPLIAVENPEDDMQSEDPLEEGQTKCERLMVHFSSRVQNSPPHQHHQLRLELQRRLTEIRLSALHQHRLWLAEKQRLREQYLQQADRLLASSQPVSPSLAEPCRSTLADLLQFESEHSWALQLRHQLQLQLRGGSRGEDSWRVLHTPLLQMLMQKSHPLSRLRQRLQFALFSRLRPLVEQHAGLLSASDEPADADELPLRQEAFRRHLRNIVSDMQDGILLLSSVLLALVPSLSSLQPAVTALTRRVLAAPLWPPLLVLYRLVNLRCERQLAAALTRKQPELEVPDQAKTLLRQMLAATCPEQKCVLLVRLVKLLCSPALSAHLPPLGADELLPRLTAVVVWSRCCQLPSELQYIGDFLADQAFRGERGYCLTSLHTAVMCLLQQ